MSDFTQAHGNSGGAPEGAASLTSSGTIAARARGGERFLLPAYAATLFLGAFLIFALQPLFAKMVLPLLGGAPNVWITASLFFQTMLLLGYIYAHGLARLLRGRTMVVVHCLVLLSGLAFLPVAVAGLEPSPDLPVLWLIGLLTVSIGLPFFAVSATAPLLQRWFAHSNHGDASDPYFLYGASNLGSMLALLSYPFLVEPLLRLDQQSWIWSSGYVALVAAIALCGLLAHRRGAATRSADPGVMADAPPLVWRQRLFWVALAFAPSSLLLGVTNYITTDIAAVPLLWVLPLALYLLTFVLIFARRRRVSHPWMVRLQPFVIVFALLPGTIDAGVWLIVGGHLAAFFVTAMVCHGELAARRPAAGHLTEFYIWMAFGGMLGGVFNALVAPAVFDGPYEYAIALVAALLLRPGAIGGTRAQRYSDLLVPGAFLALVLAPRALFGYEPEPAHAGQLFLYAIVAYLAILMFTHRPLRYGLAIGVLLFANGQFFALPGVQSQERSFFGVYRILAKGGGETYAFVNGTTLHGIQYAARDRWREPLSYYSRPGPLGQLFATLEGDARVQSVGVVGLGVGSALCYREPGQTWWLYEIDPAVGRIAQDSRYFHYLETCGEPETTHLRYGDGRLLLEAAAEGGLDLLILDAFSSDAVPVHLMTREAFALYRRKLGPEGIIAVNVSNRHLDLSGVLGAVAAEAGLVGLVQVDDWERPEGDYTYPSIWVVLSADPERLAPLRADPRWKPLEAPPGVRPWTDDFSNVLSVLR